MTIMWRKNLFVGGLVVLCSALTGLLVHAVDSFPKDSTPPEAIRVNLDEYFAQHPLGNAEPTRADKVFSSPRCVVNLVLNKGPLIGRHVHSSADEIVFVYKGMGEMYLNGQWTPVKAGDLHVCPRGTAHATRVVGDQQMEVISIFAPPQAGGNDRIMLDK
jgi:quercetin dioxygenase-like cupin family protein